MSAVAVLDVATLGDRESAEQCLVSLSAAVEGYLQASKSPATRKAYRSDLAHFELWAHGAGLATLPATADTVALYIAALAGKGAAVATIERRAQEREAAMVRARAAIRYAAPVLPLPRLRPVLTPTCGPRLWGGRRSDCRRVAGACGTLP